ALAGSPQGSDAELSPEESELVAGWDSALALVLSEAAGPGRGPIEVDLPAALSTSQLLQLARDPDGFAAELVRPLPHPPVPAARLGTRFHAWVESLFGERPLLEPGELPGAADADLTDDELAALQESFLASDWADRRPHAVEVPFQLFLGGRVLRGRIDAVYPDGADRWHVVDWKTGAEASDPLQLAVYRLGWARLAGVAPEAVRASFLYVRTGELVSPPDLPGEQALRRLLGTGRSGRRSL
ncbi:MAG: PD-(D/E)XK nuclease family protein, partial [Mycobacteriales bacterium]